MTEKKKRPPREGFRRRINPYYGGMDRRRIAADVAKTVGKWALFTVAAYAYWAVLLLLLSIFLLNVWKVKLAELLLWALALCAVSSLVYAGVLVHRKFYY